jgi:hypothetical protein
VGAVVRDRRLHAREERPAQDLAADDPTGATGAPRAPRARASDQLPLVTVMTVLTVGGLGLLFGC